MQENQLASKIRANHAQNSTETAHASKRNCSKTLLKAGTSALAGLSALSVPALAETPAAAPAPAAVATQQDAPLQEQALTLQGSAVRSKKVFIATVSVYKIDLLLEEPSSKLDVLLSSDQRIQLKMKMLRSVTAQQMRDATRASFRSNLNGEEYRALQPKINDFLRNCCSNMSSGNISSVSFCSDSVKVEKNGRLVKEYKGAAHQFRFVLRHVGSLQGERFFLIDVETCRVCKLVVEDSSGVGEFIQQWAEGLNGIVYTFEPGANTNRSPVNFPGQPALSTLSPKGGGIPKICAKRSKPSSIRVFSSLC